MANGLKSNLRARSREEWSGVTLASERIGDVLYFVGRNVGEATGRAHLDEVYI